MSSAVAVEAASRQNGPFREFAGIGGWRPWRRCCVLLAWTVTGPEWSRPRTGKTTDMAPLPGYVLSYATVSQEYQRFTGKALKDDALAAQFAAATQHMSKHDYGSAAQMLEEISKKAAVPAIYNDLGLVYLAQNDRGQRRQRVPRSALARYRLPAGAAEYGPPEGDRSRKHRTSDA